MKISKIRPWVVSLPWNDSPSLGSPSGVWNDRILVFVQVDTDEGITGWGEITTYPGEIANTAVAAFVEKVGEWLVGEDAERIEMIWHKVFRQMTYLGTRGATTACLSAIDIALWDIRGKSLGLPVYKLLGGAVRDDIPLYTHPPEPKTPEQAARDAKEITANGYEALKMDPMMHAIEGDSPNATYLDGEISQKGEAEAIEIVAAVREAVGPQTEILIDAHGKYNVPTAIRLANKMEPYGIHWFEEPVPVESWKALKQVREAVNVAISVGERLHTRWEIVPILENNLTDYLMPDVTWTGGISELRKIAAMAEAYYIPVTPHDASGPVNVMAGAQVMMNTPNFYKLETSRWDLSSYNPLIDTPLKIENGRLKVPDTPGIGVELNIDYLAAHQV